MAAPDADIGIVAGRITQLGTALAAGKREIDAAGRVVGIFTDGVLCGEINISSIQRGPFQSAYMGYWIDESQAGRGLMPEALVVVARFAFEELHLHRIQVSIIPRNAASRRVVDKLGLRCEGIADRYLEIAGVWEDHARYAMTAEEWEERRDELATAWVRKEALLKASGDGLSVDPASVRLEAVSMDRLSR